MAKAKKLPSGNWRVQVFSHYETAVLPDGTEKKKRIYESFTAATKREAERLAAVWAADRTDRPEDITVMEAVTQYISLKTPVLSPSTIAGYEKIKRNYFDGIGDVMVPNLSDTGVQAWVGRLASKISPKSVRNAYGLLSSVIRTYRPGKPLNATLPASKRPELYTPSDEDIKILLDHINGTELEIAVLLAAFGPMRRGEICALESSDISGNVISVTKSMVRDSEGNWHIKQPKTYSSYRKISYPDFVISRIAGIEGRIIKAHPDQITNRFKRAVRFSHLPHFRFHDLRHYAASIMHAIGIPDQYIMARGGWRTDNVMKTVYRNVIDLEEARQTKRINAHFEDMQHEMQHEN